MPHVVYGEQCVWRGDRSLAHHGDADADAQPAEVRPSARVADGGVVGVRDDAVQAQGQLHQTIERWCGRHTGQTQVSKDGGTQAEGPTVVQ
jgi:hypothetical protein